jgi:aldehyde dehydrogenase
MSTTNACSLKARGGSAPVPLDRDALVATIVAEVLSRLPKDGLVAARSPKAGAMGVFDTVDDAVAAATESQKKVAALSLDERAKMIEIIRDLCSENADEWALAEFEETKIGRLEHKVAKLHLVRKVLGVEAMRSDVRTNSSGVSIIEAAPWGVVAMALPATHSAPRGMCLSSRLTRRPRRSPRGPSRR